MTVTETETTAAPPAPGDDLFGRPPPPTRQLPACGGCGLRAEPFRDEFCWLCTHNGQMAFVLRGRDRPREQEKPRASRPTSGGPAPETTFIPGGRRWVSNFTGERLELTPDGRLVRTGEAAARTGLSRDVPGVWTPATAAEYARRRGYRPIGDDPGPLRRVPGRPVDAEADGCRETPLGLFIKSAPVAPAANTVFSTAELAARLDRYARRAEQGLPLFGPAEAVA